MYCSLESGNWTGMVEPQIQQKWARSGWPWPMEHTTATDNNFYTTTGKRD